MTDLDAVPETQVFEQASRTSIVATFSGEISMQRMSARQAKNGFGRQIDLARVESVSIEKHGWAAGVALAVEEHECLAANESAKDQGTAAGRL